MRETVGLQVDAVTFGRLLREIFGEIVLWHTEPLDNTAEIISGVHVEVEPRRYRHTFVIGEKK